MPEPTHKEIDERLAKLPARVVEMLVEHSAPDPPDYAMFKIQANEELRPFVEHFEANFHRGNIVESYRDAVNVFADAKWQLWKRVQYGPEYCSSITLKKFKLLFSFFSDDLRIYDLQYQLVHEKDEGRLSKIRDEFQELFKGMGVCRFIEAMEAMKCGDIDTALSCVNEALNVTPDTPDYRLLRADILRLQASLEEHATLDDNPDHPMAQARVRINTQLDRLHEQLVDGELELDDFLHQVEGSVENLTHSDQISESDFDHEIRARLDRFEKLESKVVCFLRTAECLLELSLEWNDYSPVAIEFAKAVERQLLYQVFKPIQRDERRLQVQPGTPLAKFLDGGRDLTIGQMGFLLLGALKSKSSRRKPDDDALRQRLLDSYDPDLLRELKIQLTPEMVDKYRNAPAHPESTNRATAEEGREWSYRVLDLLLSA